MNQTTITFWGGLRTIGGNIAEIKYGNDRVIFDFGLVYDPSTTVIQTKQRASKYVSDQLQLNAIPMIDGIYQQEDIQAGVYAFEPLKAFEETELNTAVFISHLHLDHIGAMDTIAPQIPVYLSKESKAYFHQLEKIGEGLTKQRDYTGIDYQEPLHIGAIKVTPFQTDHDAYGSMAMLVETPDLTVLYSGDIRMHGQHPEYNQALIKAMQDYTIDLLLLEGTSFRPHTEEKSTADQTSVQSEKEIASFIAKKLNAQDRLAVFNIYHRNLDRIEHMIDVGNRTKRTVVFELATAHLADRFASDKQFAILVPSREALTVWEQDLMDRYPIVNATQINQAPATYFVQNSFDRITDLLDLEVQGALYFHSNGMPLGAFDPNYHALLGLLEQLGLIYQSVNVSGHATQSDILALIDAIQPRLLVPWHSHYPELVIPNNPEQAVFLPAKATYVYNDGTLNKI